MSKSEIERLRELDRQRSEPPVVVSSGFNEETLRQAIEDAKAVRATALANAKLALEEAFAEKSAEMDIQIRRQILHD